MPVRKIYIAPEFAGQRIDNFLISKLKGLPKSRLYRAIRKGEVRVNQKRVKPEYRLQANDEIRIPPLQLAASKQASPISSNLRDKLESRIIYEDARVIIINKPSGLPVHGGTGLFAGLIDVLRQIRAKDRYFELVHRLDKETSGCLIIAKKRSILKQLHQLLVEKKIEKRYLALVQGDWPTNLTKVSAPLKKNILLSGERVVRVNQAGKEAVTVFAPLRHYSGATLVMATPITGRTHQIRVHAAHAGYPIAGDEKYGNKLFNQSLRRKGLRRLFLHSASIGFIVKEPALNIAICACLDRELLNVLQKL